MKRYMRLKELMRQSYSRGIGGARRPFPELRARQTALAAIKAYERREGRKQRKQARRTANAETLKLLKLELLVFPSRHGGDRCSLSAVLRAHKRA